MEDSTFVPNISTNDSQSLHTFAETDPLHPIEKEQITYGAFLVSFLILALASFLKYFVNGSVSKKGLCQFALELSIDTLTITIAVLTSYYYRVSSMSKLMGLILLAIIFIALSSACRRGILDNKITASWKVVATYIVCWLVCIMGIFIVYSIVI